MDSENTELGRRVNQALKQLVSVLQTHQVNYALIGGLAFGIRSRPRSTKDVDVILNISQIKLPAVLADLQEHGFAFDQQEVIQQWVREHMVVLDYQGVRIDWLKPALPLYQHVLDAARIETWLDSPLRVASSEGVILTKLIAFRSQDIADIESLIAANDESLDIAWITQEWNTISDEADPRFQRFKELLERQNESSSKPVSAPESPPPRSTPPA